MIINIFHQNLRFVLAKMSALFLYHFHSFKYDYHTVSWDFQYTQALSFRRDNGLSNADALAPWSGKICLLYCLQKNTREIFLSDWAKSLEGVLVKNVLLARYFFGMPWTRWAWNISSLFFLNAPRKLNKFSTIRSS